RTAAQTLLLPIVVCRGAIELRKILRRAPPSGKRAHPSMLLLPTFLLFSASALPQDPPKTKEPWSQAELERIADEIRGQIEQLRGMKFTRPVAAKLTDKKGFIEYA